MILNNSDHDADAPEEDALAWLEIVDTPPNTAYSFANSRVDIGQRVPRRKKRKEAHRPVNVLHLYFKDVSKQPIIHGRAELIPLLRRIMCGVFFEKLGIDPVHIGDVYDAIGNIVQEFNISAAQHGLPALDLIALREEIDAHFDKLDQIFPASLSRSVGDPPTDYEDEAAWAHLERGWQCLYLLALLPRFLRTLDSDYIDPVSIARQVRARLEEADRARQRLLEGTLRYVISIATTYIGRRVPYEDLVQEGFFGIDRAIETYREYRGTHFQRHAATWIHQRLGRSVLDLGTTIRLPIHVWEKLNALRERVEAQLDRGATFPKAKELLTADDDEKDLKKTLRRYHIAYSPLLSLETARLPQWQTGEAGKRIENIFVDMHDYPEEIDQSLLRDDLSHSLGKLSPRTQEVMGYRLGLLTGEKITLEEIGQQYGLTRERIRQIEAKAIKQLGKPSSGEKLRAYYDSLDIDETRADPTYFRQLRNGLENYDLLLTSQPAPRESRQVHRLIDIYIERARTRRKLDSRRSK